jgi:hypothetical protein
MNVGVGVYQIQRPQANHFAKSERLGKGGKKTTFKAWLFIVFDELRGNKGC